MNEIKPDETVFRGRWIDANSKLQPDATCERIDELVRTHLEAIKSDSSGWDMLYRDPTDGRLWELTYPESSVEGGGPPLLQCISRESALEKYGTCW